MKKGTSGFAQLQPRIIGNGRIFKVTESIKALSTADLTTVLL